MALLSGVGLALTLVFSCLLLALVAEVYYLLWWKKQRITSCNSNNSSGNSNSLELDYSNHTKEMFYLFCWDKPNLNAAEQNSNPNPNPNLNQNPVSNSDLETGLESPNKDESVEAELARLHNLVGPPRFLFTIKEESKEDLESNTDVKSRSTSLMSDLIFSQTPLFLSPMNSPSNFSGCKNNNYSNPLFESSIEAELAKLRSSPPPKFKFLRDAEEKLYRRLLEEAQISGKGILDISQDGEEGKKDGVLVKSCSSQVLSIDHSSLSSSLDKKQALQ